MHPYRHAYGVFQQTLLAQKFSGLQLLNYSGVMTSGPLPLTTTASFDN